jgi:microcystin-dependent protein
MAFIIPNATDIGSKYLVLDQAEPDSIDFEILGNDQSGVVRGCEVSPTSSGGISAVSVTSGVVSLNGSLYSIATNPYLTVPANPGTGSARFDLVVARLSGTGTSMNLTVLEGQESNVNPAHPKSKSRVVNVTGPGSINYFDPETDVALASIYRSSSIQSILTGHIVDKRKSVQTSISFRGTTAPTASQGSVGDLYLRTSATSNGESGLYVKRTSDSWAQLASSPIDPGVPIGTVITWIAPANPNTSVWVECNGAEVGRTGQYESLFNLLGTTYGPGDGSTSFNLPDLQGMFLAGLPAAGASLGAQYGNTNNEVSLVASQVPGHTHEINHGHTGSSAESGTHRHGTEGGSHVHAMNHGHTVTVSSNGEHTHLANYLQNANNTGPNHYLRPITDSSGTSLPSDGLLPATTSAGGHNHIVRVQEFQGFTSPSSTGSGSSTETGVHSHTVTINSTLGLLSSPNRVTAPTPVNIQPQTMYARYFIRYA